MLSQQTPSRVTWTPWVLAIAGFWFSSNLVLDLLVMPVMYISGMGAETDFAAASYSLFWSFNRLELLCAAALLTGVLALRQRPSEFEISESGSRCRWALIFGLLLLSATLLDTYWLTPEMSAMAFSLEGSARSALAPVMVGMHSCYWLLEVGKLVSLGSMAWLCLKDLRSPRTAYASAKLSG
ncbi:MAG: hypothetical protein AAF609_15760 [Cyanobacteria bacterium P01_C01_bin.120]